MKNNRVSGVREGANQDGKNTRTTSTDKSDESKQQRARCGACDGRARNPKQAAQSVRPQARLREVWVRPKANQSIVTGPDWSAVTRRHGALL